MSRWSLSSLHFLRLPMGESLRSFQSSQSQQIYSTRTRNLLCQWSRASKITLACLSHIQYGRRHDLNTMSTLDGHSKIHQILLDQTQKDSDHLTTKDAFQILSTTQNSSETSTNSAMILEVSFDVTAPVSHCATVGKYSVPVLWDKKTKSIVNNESAEIVRMFNSAFNDIAKHSDRDYYPDHLKEKIDEVNSWIYPKINNGVYRCGFAQSQEAYEIAFKSAHHMHALVSGLTVTHVGSCLRVWTDARTYSPGKGTWSEMK